MYNFTFHNATVTGSNHLSNQTAMAPLLTSIIQCYKDDTEDSCPGTPNCRKNTNEHHGMKVTIILEEFRTKGPRFSEMFKHLVPHDT